MKTVIFSFFLLFGGFSQADASYFEKKLGEAGKKIDEASAESKARAEEAKLKLSEAAQDLKRTAQDVKNKADESGWTDRLNKAATALGAGIKTAWQHLWEESPKAANDQK